MDLSNFQNTFYRIRSNKIFEIFIIAIIIISALLIGAKTYDIPPQLRTFIYLLDFGITLIFLVEITIRFLGEENKWRFFHSAWNVFDTLIVIISLIPIEDGELALVGRLIRIFRVLRMISIIPELRLLLNSLLKAMPQLGYVVALMFIIFYIYAAIGSTVFGNINTNLWGDISLSMLTLFRIMTFEDWTDVMYETMEVYPLSWLFYLSFIFLTTFAFLNMVIGIVVNVLEQENARVKEVEEHAKGVPTIEDLSVQIEELKSMIAAQQQSKPPSGPS